MSEDSESLEEIKKENEEKLKQIRTEISQKEKQEEELVREKFRLEIGKKLVDNPPSQEEFNKSAEQFVNEWKSKKQIQESANFDIEQFVSPNDNFKSCHASGYLKDGIFYRTIFLEKQGKYSEIVITENAKLIEVKNNEIELIKNGKKKSDIQDDEKYLFFEFCDTIYKFKVDLFYSDSLKINHVSNGVILMLNKKQEADLLYDRLREKISEYWEHFNQYEYDIACVQVIKSYISRALGKTFYLILQGKEDTGKSTLQKTIALLQFNGRFSGKGTMAVNARLIHCLGANINQDEFDKMNDEERKTFIGFLNTGLYADGTYSICDTNKKRLRDQITDLYTFCEKSFSTNNIAEFDSTLLSRSYILITTRQSRILKDINDITQNQLEEFQQLRNELFVYCIQNCKAIKTCIDDVKQELQKEGIFGRKTDMNSILLGIIKHFKGDYYLNVKEHLKEREGLTQEERASTKEGLVFQYLFERFLTDKKVVEVSNKEITEYVAAELNLNETEQKNVTRSIGWILKNYNLLRRKDHVKRGSKGARQYIIEKDIFVDILKRFQFNELLNKLCTSNLSSETVKTTKTTDDNDVSEVSEHTLPTIPEATHKIEPIADSTNLKVLDANKVRQEILNLCHGRLLDIQEFINRYPDFEDSIVVLVDDMKSKSEVIESKAGFLLKLE